jgi:hypothetical protein
MDAGSGFAFPIPPSPFHLLQGIISVAIGGNWVMFSELVKIHG